MDAARGPQTSRRSTRADIWTTTVSIVMTTPEGGDAPVAGAPAAPETPKSPPPAASVRMTVGPRPDPPSVVVSVPSGYDEPAGTLQVEVSDPHRVGEGMSKHVEYKVTYWTDLANYGARSGCVTRRYSDFEWLWKQLRSTMDGVIVPALPQKTLVPNDDPTSAAIERRRATLALFIARVAAHPVMRASSDLQIFLEEEDKAAWSTRVPWYERGVTSDALRGVSDWFQNTVRLDDTGTAANLIAGAQDAAAAAAAAARNAASGAAPAPAPAANALPGVTPEGTVTLPPIVTGAAVAAPPGVMLPPSPQHAGPNASAPSDGIVETQHFLEVADYVSKLKQRVDKLHLATSALVKHSQHTSTTLMQFAATVTELEEAETKAIAAFARGAATETGSDSESARSAAAAEAAAAAAAASTRRVEWTRAATLFASTSAPPAAHAEAVTAVFLEPLEAAGALCQACGDACDARKAIVEHYNRLCRQIERLDAKAAAMGVPEPGPKREEKQKVELAASDLRIARTQAMSRYELCADRVERELLWFHTELARGLGAALKDLVAAQGAAAGRAARACEGHFDVVRGMLADPPSAFVGEGA